MIDVQEFARRLSTLGPAVTTEDIEDLADAAGVRIDPARGIDADQAQRMLDHHSSSAGVSGVELVATQWPPSADVRSVAPPVVFSSPGAVDNPTGPPARPRRSGPAHHGRPDSRRSGR
ncbi:hypothetical protein [Actinoplanes sp. L3-i22]|uniref:hypothetical protein n=1 Tax=Actinoplanes sp. L3-i22 TaxID=2836373 RepID=UPI001C8511F7|nr:hypothetical protein [Actinoplanes sp. L3-i22]